MKNNIPSIKAIVISIALLGVMMGFQNCAETVFSNNGVKKASEPVAPNDTDDTDETDDNDDPPTEVVDNEPPGDDDNNNPPGDDEPENPPHDHDDDCGCGKKRYPKKIKRAFTVAFEDLFPDLTSQQSDNDYNDFVVDYKVKEYNKGRRLKKIVIEFEPKVKMAGYNHSFLINLVGERTTNGDLPDAIATRPAFKGCATATLQTYGFDGELIGVKEVDPTRDITIFESTKDLFSNNYKCRPERSAKLVVHIGEPWKNRARRQVQKDRYRVMLYVKNTKDVIELVDINPTHMSPDGYPYGISVPKGFIIPGERKHIETLYPKFALYREYLLKKQADPSYQGTEDEIRWFENLVPPIAAIDYVCVKPAKTGA